jgi:hypothetical protein
VAPVRWVRLYKQLAQIQRCFLLLVGIQVPPSKRFSRLHEEQNLSDGDVVSGAGGVVVVIFLQPNLFYSLTNKTPILPQERQLTVKLGRT